VNEPLRITLADVASFLQAEGIAYALIGGLAVSVRGQPRMTADVDLVIAADIERALALVASLPQSRFRPLFQDVEEVVTRAFLLPLRHRSTNVKVDVAVGLSGFEQQAVARAEPIELAGSQVKVATAEDLLIMKLLAGRPQDEQDIRGLLVAQANRLDWDYCLKVGSELGDALGQDLAGRVRALRGGDE
jgi:predicted nucleotidyltransferase